MNRSPLTTGALAVVATSALIGLGTTTATALTPDPMTAGTTHERGIVLDCTGSLGGQGVIVNLYENNTYGNFLEVLVADGTKNEAGVSTEPKRAFLTGDKVRATARLAGKKVTVTGTAKRTGKTEPVREVIDDAGLRIVSKGTHKPLRTTLTFTHGDRSTKLMCGDAFAYDLKVKKTSVVD